MPSLWLLEMLRVAQRRLATASNTNSTTMGFFDQVILRMGNDEFESSEALPYDVLVKTVNNSKLV